MGVMVCKPAGCVRREIGRRIRGWGRGWDADVVGWGCVGAGRETEKGGRVLWVGRDGRAGGGEGVYWCWMGRGGGTKDLCTVVETPENPEDTVHSIDSVGLVRNKGTSFVEAQKRGKGEKKRPISEILGKGILKPEGALRMG